MHTVSILAQTILRIGQLCRERFGDSEETAAQFGTVEEALQRECPSMCTIRIEGETIVGKGI
jgi:hypothetical protein